VKSWHSQCKHKIPVQIDEAIRRTRQCKHCGKKYGTYEIDDKMFKFLVDVLKIFNILTAEERN